MFTNQVLPLDVLLAGYGRVIGLLIELTDSVESHDARESRDGFDREEGQEHNIQRRVGGGHDTERDDCQDPSRCSKGSSSEKRSPSQLAY